MENVGRDGGEGQCIIVSWQTSEKATEMQVDFPFDRFVSRMIHNSDVKTCLASLFPQT